MKRLFHLVWLAVLLTGWPATLLGSDDGQSSEPSAVADSDNSSGSERDESGPSLAEGSVLPSNQGASTKEDPLDGRSVEYWIDQLSSRAYARRERATSVLLKAGDEAVEALVEASQDGDFEVVSRTMRILQQAASKQKVDDEGGALASLRSIADSGLGARGIAARQVLRSLRVFRDQRAREKLLEAGVEIGQSLFLPNEPKLQYMIRIGDDWGGDLDALKWIRWIRGIDTLVLSGKACSDDVLRASCQLKTLEQIQLNTGKLSADGLDALTDLERIQHLGINYVSLADDVDDAIVRLPLVRNLVIRNDQLPTESEEKIRAAFPAVAVEISAGGFLGVQAGVSPGQCQIGSVIPGGAAIKAGVRARDIIEKVNGQPIVDFFELKEQIGKLGPGEPLNLQIQRFEDGESRTLEIRAVLQRVDLP